MILYISNKKLSDTTYLQGLGHCKGTPASELKIGDTILWNNGGASTVTAIEKTTKSFVWISEKYEGTNYPRKLKKDRIVARPSTELIVEKV